MRLVLCDAHRMFVDALEAGLVHRGHTVAAACVDLDDLVDLVAIHQPDVCVLDVNVGGRSMLKSVALIRERHPEIGIVLLTGAATDEDWVALEEGLVDGLVNKLCDISVLNRSLERVHAGERVVERFVRPIGTTARTSGLPRLSERERAVVSQMVSGATTEEMAAALGVSTQTVRTHVQSVLRKFCVNSRSRAVSMAVDLGATTAEAPGVDGWPLVPDPVEDEEWERPVSLLLVDDHRVFAEALAAVMRPQERIASIEVACSLNEARANLHRSRPDLIMLDFHLADEVGLDLLADLDQMPDRPAVLIVSGVDRAQLAVQAFDAGAQGWVSKTAPFETLMFAASEVARGRMYLAPESVKPVLRCLLAQSRIRAAEPSFIDDLTSRQTEVLQCLVSGMSRAECADHLSVSVHTVRTHVQQLLKRAGLHSTLALASRARELGVRGIDSQPSSPEWMAAIG